MVTRILVEEKMNKEEYLNRINYSGELKPNINVLRELQRIHLFNVPFENLDIHSQTPIELDIDKIHKKIVSNNRGGFCYELNGLFYELLVSLKFKVKKISARVYDKKKGYSPEFDHCGIIVETDGAEFLVDVGFGEFTFEPLKIELNTVQTDPNGDFVIDKYNDEYFRVNKVVNGELVPEYIFKKTERELLDFKEMCYYHQSNPNSHFMKKRLISLPTKNGRITISGNTLKIKENDSVQEKTLKDEDDFNNQLLKFFKIKQ